ncbi:MAG: T9SS type A sorting domain-containing protein, partial [Bacteroidales bacterium]|nr:T9SS type A sorting domain-containing protein [Bacteroidales bacterium]
DVQGTYAITWNFDDGNGNDINVVQNVVVEDLTDPSIMCQSSLTLISDEGQDYYTVQGSELDATAIDNCAIASISNNVNESSSLIGEVFTIGTYNIIWSVEDEAGRVNSCSTSLTITENVGIEDIRDANIQVYPNPAKDLVKVKWILLNNDVLNVTLVDMSGRVISSEEWSVIKSQDERTMNISHLSSGTYFLLIRSENIDRNIKLIKTDE